MSVFNGFLQNIIVVFKGKIIFLQGFSRILKKYIPIKSIYSGMERVNEYVYFNSSTIDFNYMLFDFASDGFNADD